MNKRLTNTALTCILLVSATAFAQTNTTAPTQPNNKINIITCPPAKSLKKTQKLTWVAPGGFKSFSTSFVEQIQNFLGAQWNGAGLGQVTCVYEGKALHSFPVLLQYGTLALEPNTGKWGPNKGGYRNCVSEKQSECTFRILLKPKKENIYQEAEQLKSPNGNIE